MAELKTKETAASVEGFLAGVEDEGRRRDCWTVLEIMREVTGDAPKMWGPSIVGFGSYHYRYESGHEGDSCVVGFSPRKKELTLYIMSGFERREALLAKLGKHKTGKACLYLKSLAGVDLGVLRELVAESVRHVRQKHPAT